MLGNLRNDSRTPQAHAKWLGKRRFPCPIGHPRAWKLDVLRSLLQFLISGFLLSCVLRPAPAQINFIRGKSAVPTSTATIAAAYSSAQTVGNMNNAVIGWDSSSITLKSLTDSQGNSYRLAVSYVDSTGITQAIYYAPNIAAAAAGENTVTATLSASTGWPDLRILEYSGVNTLDKTASAKGTATTASSGSVGTTQANGNAAGTCCGRPLPLLGGGQS